jgi:hypothetical protein
MKRVSPQPLLIPIVVYTVLWANYLDLSGGG